VEAVGKMRAILGVGGMVVLLVAGVLEEGEVERAGKKVFESHFSPTEATEETWAMICGGVGVVEGVGGDEGMWRRMFLRAGQPQRVSFSGSRL